MIELAEKNNNIATKNNNKALKFRFSIFLELQTTKNIYCNERKLLDAERV